MSNKGAAMEVEKRVMPRWVKIVLWIVALLILWMLIVFVAQENISGMVVV